MKKPRFIKALSMMATHFDKPVTPELLATYDFALSEFTEEQLLSVCKKLIRGRYFPRAYDFLKALRPDFDDFKTVAYLRWAEVEEHLWQGAPLPNDPSCKMAISACGGIYTMRHADEQDRRFMAHRFVNAYIGHAESRRMEQEQIEGEAGPVVAKLAESLSMEREDRR